MNYSESVFISRLPELNRRPHDYKSSALPAELRRPVGLVREPGWFPHSPAFFQAKALQKCFLYGSCSETEVSEQLYYTLNYRSCQLNAIPHGKGKLCDIADKFFFLYNNIWK